MRLAAIAQLPTILRHTAPMTARRARKPKWLAEPADHDYPAAESYLGLIYPAKRVAKLGVLLRAAAVVPFMAKDILRASALPLLSRHNVHVAREHRKIQAGTPISPLLLVRDARGARVIIADGYHRLCAVHALDEDAVVPCKVA